MKKIGWGLLIALAVWSCNNNSNGPDVSGIKVELKLERFERGFFAVDTNNIGPGLIKTHDEFPDFYPDFMQNILGVSGNPADTTTLSVTKNILRSYGSFAAELEKKFSNTSALENELRHDFQFVKYYFPNYKIPALVTYVGPLDAPGVALTRNRIAIGLQQYAGKDFQGYQVNEVQQMYPAYISRRFDAAYIPANCIKAITDDLFPERSAGKPLIEQMIEKGKQWWLLDKLMPATADSLKTGYTQKQLKWCKENEGLIWNYFVTSENLEAIEPDIIQNYIGESPTTQGMPQASPGNIGQWIGWQIVKKFVGENSSLRLAEIMNTPPRKILTEAKYKPK
ncbi:MAG TPA: hypothetical protein VGQ53_16785 [Chitinophagaceae bacterium]|jgi:hypothetical protein|nr:hypothetical protein [Chitinophagaceae bacterium]